MKTAKVWMLLLLVLALTLGGFALPAAASSIMDDEENWEDEDWEDEDEDDEEPAGNGATSSDNGNMSLTLTKGKLYYIGDDNDGIFAVLNNVDLEKYNVEFTTSNSKVASVNKRNGKVTIREKAGTATINAVFINKKTKSKSTIRLSVRIRVYRRATAVKLTDEVAATLKKGLQPGQKVQLYSLKSWTNPASWAADSCESGKRASEIKTTIKYGLSKNTAGAKVTSTGLLTVERPGSFELRLTCEGKTKTYKVIVGDQSHRIIRPEASNIRAGETITLEAWEDNGDRKRNDVRLRNGVWSSDAPEIAEVNAGSGLVTAISPGIATITYTSDDNPYAASALVAVSSGDFTLDPQIVFAKKTDAPTAVRAVLPEGYQGEAAWHVTNEQIARLASTENGAATLKFQNDGVAYLFATLPETGDTAIAQLIVGTSYQNAWRVNQAYRVITALKHGGGKGSTKSSPEYALEGETVTLTAKARSGSRFLRWESEDVTIGGDTFIMPAKEVTVRAVFELITYTIAVRARGEGQAAASLGTAAAGQEVELSAAPEVGWRFARWESGDIAVEGDSFAMPAKNVVITAVFEPEIYTVTLESIYGEAFAKPSEAAMGESVTLSALPDEGYAFVGWESEDVEITENAFIMPAGDVKVTAVFEPLPFEIFVNAEGGGLASASPNPALVGEMVTLTAQPEPGYHPVVWESDDVAILDSSFIMPARPVTIQAYFDPINYAVTVDVRGEGSATADMMIAITGSVVNLTANPAEGYRFAGWESGEVSIEGDSFVMPARDVSVTAVFEPVYYTVAVASRGEGSAAANPHTAMPGERIKLTASPAQGYHFVRWESADVEIAEGDFIMPTRNVSVTAVFEPTTYSTRVQARGEGGVSVSPNPARPGGLVRLTALPVEGWHFAGWESDGVTITDNTFIMPDSDVVITAVFLYSVSSVTLNTAEVALDTGASGTLTATVLPEFAANRSVLWSSSNESVATVSGGLVQAVSSGVAVITAASAENPNIYAECVVTVSDPPPPPPPVEEISEPVAVAVSRVLIDVEMWRKNFNNPTVGDTLQLSFTVYPAGASYTSVVWSTDAPSAISITSGGLAEIIGHQLPSEPGSPRIYVTVDGVRSENACLINTIEFPPVP